MENEAEVNLMMGKAITFAKAGAVAMILIASAVGMAWAQKAAVIPGKATPAITTAAQSPQSTHVRPSVITGGSYNPATVTFTSSNPDLSVAGIPTSSAIFSTAGNPASLHIYAVAASPNFTGCNAPPAGAVRVTCSGASGVTCVASNTPLTNTGNGITVVTGSGNKTNASFNVNYTFQDAWNYQVGAACTLNVQFTYTEP